MNLLDYINSDDNVLNSANIFTLGKYEYLLQYLVATHPAKYSTINYTPDVIHDNTIYDQFLKNSHKILLISNLDIDFPPPKLPYEYDAYFDSDVLPHNYEHIPYCNKINNSIVSLIEQNNNRVFAHAVSIQHERIQMIPAGVYNRFNHFHLKTLPKTILCYANFGLSCDRWFGNPRNIVLRDIITKDFIVKENIISTEVVRRDCMDCDYFYKQISHSKFTICPRGCGIDTYRLWDCICLGCIPIVEKYGGYESFTDLPILFINSIEEYGKLTEEYLQHTYDYMITQKYNYNKLTLDYWIDHITNTII